MASDSKEVWNLAERLMNDILKAIRQIDELAPAFPDELFEARDNGGEGMTVADFLDRLARHSLQHRHEVAAVRASIGAARSTDPSDSDPRTDEPYSKRWYQWTLLEAFLRRAEMVSELIGLKDEDLDRKPSPEHVASNDRSVREVCEHVLGVQEWIVRGVEEGVKGYRESEEGKAD